MMSAPSSYAICSASAIMSFVVEGLRQEEMRYSRRVTPGATPKKVALPVVLEPGRVWGYGAVFLAKRSYGHTDKHKPSSNIHFYTIFVLPDCIPVQIKFVKIKFIKTNIETACRMIK